jgi:hypothetical protein
MATEEWGIRRKLPYLWRDAYWALGTAGFNDRWRVWFIWTKEGPGHVEIVDCR